MVNNIKKEKQLIQSKQSKTVQNCQKWSKIVKNGIKKRFTKKTVKNDKKMVKTNFF